MNIKKNQKKSHNNILLDEHKFNSIIENQQEPIQKIKNYDNHQKKMNNQLKSKENLKIENFLIKILIICFALFQLLFELYPSNSNSQIISPKEIKDKIITIGFYDSINCDRKWRRVKKGYFYDLPKYTNKFRWVFLAKYGIDPQCKNYTHLTFTIADNYNNLEKAVLDNKIDIIIQNEDESLIEQKYLLLLKKKYGIKLIQIMHEYYFFFLINIGVIHTYNDKWKPLKNFDAIISSVPSQIYMYHLQKLNQSIYLPQFLPFEYRDIVPSNLETKNILMIGRISIEKQYELGIKAMPYIIEKIPDAKLNIIGGFNQYTKSLKMLAQDLNVSNNVIFYDLQQDLRPFYSNASIYFMTSSSESFSFVLAEAKAYGLANIVTGKKYLVLTKKGSIVVKDNDYIEMAKETIKLFSNLTYLKEQGKSARDSLDNFLTEKVELRYINLYESLMNGTSKKLFDEEYKKYINETESLKDLKSSLELAKTINYNKFHCLKFEDFVKPFEKINISFCDKQK